MAGYRSLGLRDRVFGFLDRLLSRLTEEGGHNAMQVRIISHSIRLVPIHL